jgi:hypothetical protein
VLSIINERKVRGSDGFCISKGSITDREAVYYVLLLKGVKQINADIRCILSIHATFSGFSLAYPKDFL